MAFRSPPKSDYDSDKGRYAPVHIHASPPPKKGGRLVGLLFVAAMLVAGVVLMIAHHLFDRHLDGKSIDSATHELPPVLQNQVYVNFIGTTIAHGVRIAFSMAIGVTFGQLFWSVLRSGNHTIAQIDALVNCGRSPFSLSGLRAMTASFSLFVISVVAAAMALVVVFSPGALTVQTNVQRSNACSVPSVPLSVMDVNYTFDAKEAFPTDSVMMDILTSNSYMRPFQGDLAAICGTNLGCSYNLTFIGPAAQCIDVTAQTNWTKAPISQSSGGNLTMIYKSQSDGSPGVNITLYDMVKGEFLATNCVAYNSTYEVGIEGSPPTIRVWNVTLNEELIYSHPLPFMGSYAVVAFESIVGSVLAGPNGYIINGGQSPSSPQVNQFFETTSTGNHTFSTTAAQFASTLLQNATLSLLSGNIAYNLTGSVDTARNLQSFETTCTSSVTVYQYDSKRLLATDGAALAVTAIVVFIGCCLLVRNGREQKLSFADITHIALNEQLFAVSQTGNLDGKTRVYLETSDHALGRLLPVTPIGQGHTTFDRSNSSLLGTKELYPNRELPSVPRRSSSKRITGVHVQMTLLIVATVICAALQHSYYRYLNGKVPISKLDSSQWLRNQMAVSDIGTALSYLAQVFLAVAISSACVQLLWHVIRVRDRGYPISQIDALMKVNADPLSLPIFSALGASFSVPLVALLAASTTVVSIFAPGAIKVNPNYVLTSDCTVLAPRNFSSIAGPSGTDQDYVNQNAAIISLGTYLPPVVGCDALPGSQCSYDLNFVGPGFSCENVTATANYTAFAIARVIGGSKTVNLFQADIANQTDELDMVVTVQTWDVKRAEFQAVNCTGVARAYSATLSAPGRIDVTKNDIVDKIHGNTSVSATPTSFMEYYMYNIIKSLNELIFELEFGMDPRANMQVKGAPIDSIAAVSFGSDTGGIGAYQLDGNITWQTNMSSALEALAQNVTLSLLSDTIFNYNQDDANVLTNSSTTCKYTGTAYEYTTFPLFVTYGAALAVAVVCAAWGSVAIAMNGGVAESLEFSRVLKGLMNGRMYNARVGLDERTRVKAEEGPEGALVPTL